MSWPPRSARGALLILALALTLALLLVSHGVASAATPLDGGPTYLEGQWQSVVTGLTSQITPILSGADSSHYYAWCRTILYGAALISFFWNLGKYTLGSAGLYELATATIQTWIILIAFWNYTTWTQWIWGAGFQLGGEVQIGLIGGNDANDFLKPAAYMSAVFAQFTVTPAGMFSISVMGMVYALLLVLLVVFVSASAFFLVAWPTLLFLVAQIAGLVTFPALLHERTSFLFDGWLRLVFYCGFYIFLGRISLSLMCVIVGQIFGTQYPNNPAANTQLLTAATDFPALLVLAMLAVLNCALVFEVSKLTSMIVGGGTISTGLARGVQTAVRLVAAFA
jgi:hypothetical protein